MNNPVAQMAAMMKNGGDPMTMLRQMAASDPRAALAMRMVSGKDSVQLRQMAMNMAHERGVNINELAAQLGFKK